MEYSEFIIRISIALFLSFTVGLERQWRRRAVGLRTNVLVCLGSFLFVSMPVLIGNNDIKMAAQVISGIGFLGAGVILKDGTNIRGLNTAATLWCDAAIGVLCGYGLIKEAVTGTTLILMANILLRYITLKITKYTSKKDKDYIIDIIVSKHKELIIRTMLAQEIDKEHLKINNMTTTKKEENSHIKIGISTDDKTEESIRNLVARIAVEPDVFSINYDKYSDDDYDDEN